MVVLVVVVVELDQLVVVVVSMVVDRVLVVLAVVVVYVYPLHCPPGLVDVHDELVDVEERVWVVVLVVMG